MTALERIIRTAVADELRTASEARNAASAAIPSATSSAPEILCADQLAAFLGVNRKTVYEYAARGVIPHARLGRRLVFARAAVMSCLATCKGSTSGKGI